jgi:hypothetical protein
MKKIILAGAILAIASTSVFAAKTQSQEAQLTQMQKELDWMRAQMKAFKKDAQVKPLSNKAVAAPNSTSQNLFGNLVVTAPYTGRDNYSTGTKLLVLAPSVNEDVDLLIRRAKEQAYLTSMGITLPYQPRLVLSGKVEARANYTGKYTSASTSDIDLSGAELDVFAEIGPIVNAFMDINYDKNNGPIGNTTGSRLNNGRMKLDRGFLTLGDITRSPFYGSAGQLAVPFGRYSTSMVADPLTHFGKTKARAIVVGYAPLPYNTVTPFVRAYVFKGDTKYNNGNIVKQNGIDGGINFSKGDVKGNLGAGYIRNIADSSDFQNTGNSTSGQFQGFSPSSATEHLHHGVAATDIYGNIGYAHFNLLGEYVSTIQSFNDLDVSYNSHGAKLRAYNVEGAYSFNVYNWPSSFSVGYQHSYEALALSIPEQRYIAAFQFAPVKDTEATLEFRHDIDYGKSDTANGASQATAITGTGHSINAITAQFAVFF